MATFAPLVPQLARKLLHHRRLAGAADSEIADGDHLHAERGIAQDADVVKETPDVDRRLKELGTHNNAERTIAALLPAPLEDHLQDESFQAFSPDPHFSRMWGECASGTWLEQSYELSEYSLWCHKLAERGRFELPVGYKPTHAFQACALIHSAISPLSASHLKCGSTFTRAIFFHAAWLEYAARRPSQSFQVQTHGRMTWIR